MPSPCIVSLDSSYTYITDKLVDDLKATSINPSAASAKDDPRFLAIFTHLPFELFKTCIEDPSVALGSDQERFAFAKKAIAARKKSNAQQQQQRPSAGQTPAGIENVVLSFGGGGASAVHVTRKTKQRTLWKVEKED